jgi:hypothetical protein
MRKKPLIDQLHHEDSWRLFRILAEFVEGFDKKSFRSLPLSKSTHLAKRLSERPRL